MSRIFLIRNGFDYKQLCVNTKPPVIVHEAIQYTKDTDRRFPGDKSSDQDDAASVSSSASDSGDEDDREVERRTFCAVPCRRCGNKLSTNQDLTSNLASDLACMLDKQGFVNQTQARQEINNTPSSNHTSIIQLNNVVKTLKNEIVKLQDLLPQAARTPRTTYAPERNLGAVEFDESNVPGGDELAKRSDEVAKQQGTLEYLSRELADAKAECAEQKSTIERLKSNLTAESARCNDLAGKLDASYAQEPDARTDRDPMLHKALARTETAHHHNAAPNLEYELDAANSRIAMLEDKVHEGQDMLLNMELNMQKEKTREKSELEFMQNKLREELHGAKEEIVNLREKVKDYDDMQKALAAAMQKESLLKEEIGELQTLAIPKNDHEELRKKARDYEALKEALKRSEGALRLCNRELQQTKTDLQEREEDLKNLRKTLKEEQDNAAMLQDRLAMVREDVNKDPPKDPPKEKRGFFGRLKK